MTNNNTAIALPTGEMQKSNAFTAEVVALEILQNNFTSEADRDEFSRAVKMHGVTFLQIANSPLPRPTARDLNTMGRLARSLARFWPQALVIGGCHD